MTSIKNGIIPFYCLEINKIRNTSKNQICMFRAKFDVNRLDGVLRYKPSCSRCQFPVSVESMKAAKEGWLYVWLPKGEDLTISVAPEYKDYYNIRIADD